MEEGRKDRLGHVVADDKIGVRCSEIVHVPSRSLPEGRICIGELSVGCEERGEDDRAAIERVLTSNRELFSRRQRFVILQAGCSPIVRNNAENTLSLGRRPWNVVSRA